MKKKIMQAKKTLVLGLLALAAAIPLSAKDDKDRDTCREWNKMSNLMQIWYVQGFYSGPGERCCHDFLRYFR